MEVCCHLGVQAFDITIYRKGPRQWQDVIVEMDTMTDS